jgi:hypothetical protein
MKHNEFKQMIYLSLYGELSEENKKMFETHLNSCEECRYELEQQKIFLSMVSDQLKFKVSDELLKEARAQLRGALRSEKFKYPLIFSLKEKIFAFVSSPSKLAFGAVLVLIIGFILGGLFLSREKVIIGNNNPTFTNVSYSQNDMKISNLQFVDSDLSDENIEFSFDALKRIHLKGKVSDPEIQSILTYAMLNDHNPGSRLNSINAIDVYGNISLDKDIKDALITVVMADENPGVRWEALKLMSKINYDESLKEAYLYVLLNDSSFALRIESLNALINAVKSGHQLKKNDIKLVIKQANQDDNNYIRLKSKTLLEEYN